MSKPILNIYFHGFWDTNEIIFEHYFKNSHRFLFDKYDVRVVTDPLASDVLICSVFGQAMPPEINRPKILLIHENVRPNHSWFGHFDYIISFSHGLEFNPKHFRIPYWVYRFYEHGLKLSDLQNRKLDDVDKYYTPRRFANFVYSNPFFFRREFANELSTKYRKVDFGGKVDTNLSDEERSEITPSKLGREGLTQKTTWLKKYRFTIAFENSSQEGYTTEKILDAFVGETVPLYWGNLRMKAEGFNSKAFLNYFDTPGNDNFIGKIKEVDSSKYAYLEVLNQPVFDSPPKYLNYDYMVKFYEDMIARKI
jgi:hypothetical protein